MLGSGNYCKKANRDRTPCSGKPCSYLPSYTNQFRRLIRIL